MLVEKHPSASVNPVIHQSFKNVLNLFVVFSILLLLLISIVFVVVILFVLLFIIFLFYSYQKETEFLYNINNKNSLLVPIAMTLSWVRGSGHRGVRIQT